MKISIKNCNNIDSAEITLSEGKFNIKYGLNGTGKTTISKSIRLSIEGDKELKSLIPFKCQSEPEVLLKPKVEFTGSLKTVMYFDEEYVQQFVFLKNEALKGSFEIFIKSPHYVKLEDEIKQIFSDAQIELADNDEINSLIDNLRKLSSSISFTNNNTISKRCDVHKGLAKGNPVEHVPEPLLCYRNFIQSDKSASWISWQTTGFNEFYERSSVCPFCASRIDSKYEQIKGVSTAYDQAHIKKLKLIIDIVDSLGEYFSDDTSEKINEITKKKDGLDDEHYGFIQKVKSEIEIFINKLESLKHLSSRSFGKDGDILEFLESCKLNLTYFPCINSLKTNLAIQNINDVVDALINRAGPLKGSVNQLRREMKVRVEKRESEINEFLKNTGYPYKVVIDDEDENGSIKLCPIESGGPIEEGSQHLSYGERNAFAIILFMYECISVKPDLIILDDPISSFDKNKKYAVIHTILKGDLEECLRSKTVLMLTHDFEPIIDTVKTLRKNYCEFVSAHYIKNENGVINETPIDIDDIKTFAQICREKLLSEDLNDVIKVIYLRRYFELQDNKGLAYELLSNLLHRRDRPHNEQKTQLPDGSYPKFEKEEFELASKDIKEHMSGFDYHYIIRSITNDRIKSLYRSSSNGYEKLQLFRILEHGTKCPIKRKIINETCHIENEYVCQLDPEKYDPVPRYITDECDKLIDDSLPKAS